MIPAPFYIRHAVPQDISAMANLLNELFAIETDFHSDIAKQQRGLQMLMDSRNAALFVAESNANVIGMCSLQILISTAQGSKVGLIEDVIVTKEWRGKRVGRELLEAANSWGRTRGLTRLQLLADKTNQRALNFYQKVDWKTTQLMALRVLL